MYEGNQKMGGVPGTQEPTSHKKSKINWEESVPTMKKHY